MKLLIFLFFTSFVCGQTLEETYELLEDHPGRAEGYIKLALRKYQLNPEVYLFRAKFYAYASDFDGKKCKLALKDVNTAIKFDPNNACYYAFKADVLYALNATKGVDGQLLLDSLKKAYVLDKRTLVFSINYIYGLLRFSKKEHAWRLLEPMVKAYPESYRIQSLYATYLNITDRPIAAIGVIKALSALPKPPKVDLRKVNFYHKNYVRLKNFHAKVLTLDRASRMRKPKTFIALYNYQKKLHSINGVYWHHTLNCSYFLMELGRYKEAINLSKDLLKTKINGKYRDSTYLFLARAYLRLKFYNLAEYYFDLSVKMKKNESSKVEHLHCLLVKKDYQKAQQKKNEYKDSIEGKGKLHLDAAWEFGTGYYKEFYDLDSKAGTAFSNYHFSEKLLWFNEGKLQRGREPYDAVSYLEKHKRYDLFLENCYTQALALLMVNKRIQSKKYIQLAEAYYPEDVRHGYYKALFSMKAGEFEDALVLVDSFLKKAPDDSDGVILKGLLLLYYKKYEDAKETFSQLPKSEKAYYELVTVLCQGNIIVASELATKQVVDGSKDERVFCLLYCLTHAWKPDKALKLLEGNLSIFVFAPYKDFVSSELKKLDKVKLNENLDKMIFKKTIIKFLTGLKLLQGGDQEAAKKALRECLNSFAADLPESIMAVAILRSLK